jgi:AcrR family transcriptional regulator
MSIEHGDDDAARSPGRPRDARAHESILRSTLELLLEGGYGGLTLEEVARQAEVGKTTIYRWWDSKLDLVLEAAAPHLEIGLVPDTGDTREDLEAGIAQVIRTYADQVAALVIFVVVADLEQDRRLRAIFRDRWVLPWRSSMASAIRRGVERGDLAPGIDVDFVVDVIVGTVFQRVLIVPEPETGGLTTSIADMILDGRLPAE